MPTVPAAGSSASANEHTAITIALRVPTFANCCGPRATGSSTAAISSSGASTVRFTPVKNSPTGSCRVPRTEASSTTASAASSGGWQSPAGEAEARLPPTVPRLRICGEPTVRAAAASPGSQLGQLPDQPRVRDRGADPQPAVVPDPVGQPLDPGEVEQRVRPARGRG